MSNCIGYRRRVVLVVMLATITVGELAFPALFWTITTGRVFRSSLPTASGLPRQKKTSPRFIVFMCFSPFRFFPLVVFATGEGFAFVALFATVQTGFQSPSLVRTSDRLLHLAAAHGTGLQGPSPPSTM